MLFGLPGSSRLYHHSSAGLGVVSALFTVPKRKRASRTMGWGQLVDLHYKLMTCAEECFCFINGLISLALFSLLRNI